MENAVACGWEKGHHQVKHNHTRAPIHAVDANVDDVDDAVCMCAWLDC